MSRNKSLYSSLDQISSSKLPLILLDAIKYQEVIDLGKLSHKVAFFAGPQLMSQILNLFDQECAFLDDKQRNGVSLDAFVTSLIFSSNLTYLLNRRSSKIKK